jgi:hypothetical protein
MKTLLEKLDSYLGIGKVSSIGLMGSHTDSDKPLKEASNQTLPPTEEQANVIAAAIIEYVSSDDLKEILFNHNTGEDEITNVMNFVEGRIDAEAIKSLLKSN